MAFLLSKSDDKVKVIARCDDALVVNNEEEFEKSYSDYLEDLDESKLEFHPGKQPTRFVLKKNVNLSETIKLKNDQVQVSAKGELTYKLGYMIEELRLCLVGIENPPNVEGCLEYKQDGSGGASKDLMEKIIAAGINDDLHTALMKARKSKQINKKN